MRPLRRATVLLLALLAAGACGRAGHGPRPAPPLEVRVTSQNRADINLYMLRGGTRTRLGTVVSGNTRTFLMQHLPNMVVQQLGFEVQRIGAEGVFSLPRVTVTVGQTVRIRLQELITTSEIIVVDDGVMPGNDRP